jgi:hypothetical protein
MTVTAGTGGWYTFKIRARDTPPSNPKPSYKLAVTYTAPRRLQGG